jgi:glycosyltransferase involved in cell wall biosynthesis
VSDPHRVARVITRLNIGGPSIQAIELSHRLKAEGFETSLIHGRLTNGEGDMTSLMPVDDNETIFVEELVRPLSPVQDLRALWKLYRILCRLHPEIVHTHMAKAGTLGRLAAILYNLTRGQARRARLVHTYHGHVFEGYFRSHSTRVFLSIERWLALRTDALIAISDQVAHDLLQTYRIARARQLHIVPLGFDLRPLIAISSEDRARARHALQIPEQTIVVTTVGRLTAIKQQDLFLRMAHQLVRRDGCYVFLVVGDGELRQELESAAGDLGLQPYVRFLGWRGDLDTIYGATDIFVLTSRNEGTPVALIEAMAAGIASASTDVGGVRDVITHPGVGALVPFGNVNALTSAVVALSREPVQRAEIGRRARESVRKRYDVRRLVDDIAVLYRQLLDVRVDS